MSWTDERVELLKKLWADGLSASQIAAELGGITRNAVIGKVHRLGLSGRAKSPSSSRAAAAQGALAPHMLRVSRPLDARQHRARAPTTTRPEPEPELIENIIPIGQRTTLLELTEQTCRWPIGDPGSAEFFFCGGETAERAALLRLSLRASPISRRTTAARRGRAAELDPHRVHGVRCGRVRLPATLTARSARPRRTGRRARSRRRARCGSGRRRGRG